MGDFIVLAVLGVVVAFVIRSMWNNRKKGGGCNGCTGNCASCKAGRSGHIDVR